MARNRKRHRKESEGMNESWLLPYSDMLTLLLALFIVLFAMSSLDAIKFRDLARSLNSVFSSGSGIMEFPSPNEPIVALSDNRTTEDEKAGHDERSETESVAELKDLIELQTEIDAYIEEKKLTKSLETKLSGEGLKITILDDALFESGSAEVKEGAHRLGVEISNFLVSDPPRHVTISGHTDNVPIHNAQYSSNWHLSVMRSINFMEVLLENKGLDPAYLSAKGFGEYQPIASNDNPKERAKNRRVEVLVAPNYELHMEE
ncbi:flagellar motor protein MotB [Pueribacillus theae]|uniref:Flagellar motor protein MotB n=1 Tax=Pueribacillus theae TaxID=2171751 RepID=A0A2U1K5Q7_9BACI|nr:flagellar motor protein MotB [Pueribacillus theae]PWA12585.1 flagellar motor protein MotB [Pueribacillus theae]